MGSSRSGSGRHPRSITRPDDGQSTDRRAVVVAVKEKGRRRKQNEVIHLRVEFVAVIVAVVIALGVKCRRSRSVVVEVGAVDAVGASGVCSSGC